MHPWIYEHYAEPIILDTGYNPANTITWALILGLMILLIIRIFEWLDLVLDEYLVASTLPYILAGSSLRVIEDAELIAPPFKYLLITPIIYFLVAAVAVTVLFSCRRIFDERFLTAYALLGLLWTFGNLYVLSSVGVERLWVFFAVFGLGAVISVGIWASRIPLRLGFLGDRVNFLILSSHLWDASSTFIGVDLLGYHEKHVLPTYLIELAGTAAVMYPLKLALLIPALGLIDVYLQDDPQTKNLTKLALLILGLAPAVRNTLRLILGV